MFEAGIEARRLPELVHPLYVYVYVLVSLCLTVDEESSTVDGVQLKLNSSLIGTVA